MYKTTILIVYIIILYTCNLFAGIPESPLKQNNKNIINELSPADIELLLNILQNPEKINGLISQIQVGVLNKEEDIAETIDKYTSSLHIESKIKQNIIYFHDMLYHELLDFDNETFNSWLELLFIVIMFLVLFLSLEYTVYSRLSTQIIHKILSIEKYLTVNNVTKIAFYTVIPVIASLSITIYMLYAIKSIEQNSFVANYLFLICIIVVVNRSISIINKAKNISLKQVRKIINILLFSIILFLLINSLLEYKYAKILLKINLIIFLLITSYVIFTLKNIVLQLSLNRYENKHIKNIYEKIYYILKILLFFIFSSLFFILFIDYKDIKLLLDQLFVSTIFIYLVWNGKNYLTKKISKYIVLNTVHNINNNDHVLLKEIENHQRKQFIRYNKMWKIFIFFINLTTILISLLITSKILNIDILKSFLLLLDNFIVDVLSVIFIVFFIFSSLTIFLAWLVNKNINNLLKAKENYKANKLLTTVSLLEKPYIFLVFILIIISTLIGLGISLSFIFAGAGMFTIIITVGAKDILQNFFHGIINIMEEAFAINDLVEIDGKIGVIEDISLVYVKIRMQNGSLTLIPFSNSAKISNLSKSYSYTVIDLYIAYDSQINNVKDALQEADKLVQEDPTCKDLIISSIEYNGISSMYDTSIKISAKVKTHPGKQLLVHKAYMEAIHLVFQKMNIKMSHPNSLINTNSFN